MNDSLFLLFTELLLSSFDDVLARLLLGSASLVTLGGDTLARTGMSAGLTAFTTAHRVVDGVHHNAAVARTTTEVTVATSLTTDFEVVLGVADDTYSGAAGLKNHAHFAAGHLDDSVLVVARHELCVGTCRTDHLGTLAGTELNVVDERTERNLGEQKGIADFGGNTGTGHDGLTNLEALGTEDIALLAISIADEGDTGATVGVVLDSFYNSGNTVFVALEVNKAIELFVATADIAHGHLTLVVAATAFAFAVDKALFRLGSGDVVVGNNELVTLTGGCGFNFL